MAEASSPQLGGAGQEAPQEQSMRDSPPTSAASSVTSPRKSSVATAVSIQAFKDALTRVKASPKGDVSLSLDVLDSYLTNLSEVFLSFASCFPLAFVFSQNYTMKNYVAS
jgi:hypothetical protein